MDRGLDFSSIFYWISVGALIVFILLLNIGFAIGLTTIRRKNFAYPSTARYLIEGKLYQSSQNFSSFVTQVFSRFYLEHLNICGRSPPLTNVLRVNIIYPITIVKLLRVYGSNPTFQLIYTPSFKAYIILIGSFLNWILIGSSKLDFDHCFKACYAQLQNQYSVKSFGNLILI